MERYASSQCSYPYSASAVVGAPARGHSAPVPAPHQVVQRALLYGDILDSIRESYVEDNVDVDQLFQTGVNAMLQSLDPYSAYENAQQSEDLTMRTVGRYGGVGLTIGNDKDDVIVLGALEGNTNPNPDPNPSPIPDPNPNPNHARARGQP